MNDPIVMQELERTEIEWVCMPDAVGLSIIQANRMGDGEDKLWIPSGHVPAFIAAIQRAYAKR